MMAKRIDIVRCKMVKESSVKYEKRVITSPFYGYIIVKDFLEDLDREQVMMLCLNSKNEPTNLSVISMGTVNSSLIHPREVFKIAILSNASKIMLAHNHPSGNPSPSHEDELMTKRIKDCGDMMGIQLLDHIIVGDNTYYSFKENNSIL